MDILGLGSTELIIIVLLAAIVLGPQRLAQSAREIGKLLRNLRNYFKELTGDLSKELDLLAEPQSINKDASKR
jgi:Sec-independent protein translocase protein TatA